MAKIDLKFLTALESDSYIKVESLLEGSAGIDQGENFICISGESINPDDEMEVFNIWLDKSTAIKFAKTLRTEINKINE